MRGFLVVREKRYPERGAEGKERRTRGDIGEAVERVGGGFHGHLRRFFFSRAPMKYETVSWKPQIFSRERDF